MKKKLVRPKYDHIKASIIDSLQSNYFKYKESYKKYLDLTWFGEDGSFCKMNTADDLLKEANEWQGRVSNDITLLNLCNKVIEEVENMENKETDPLTSAELELLELINFI